MPVIAPKRDKAKRKQPEIFGPESNGIVMTPQEFDEAEFDELWSYELINGVLIVSPIPLWNETDPSNTKIVLFLRFSSLQTRRDVRSLIGTKIFTQIIDERVAIFEVN